MSQQSVKCTQCGRDVILDRSHTVPVSGGAMPPTDTEHEIVCLESRVAIRFCNDDTSQSSQKS